MVFKKRGVLATPKHYLGDGGTAYGHDRGDTILNEEEIRATHLKPYITAIKNGAQSIMISFSSVNGKKMHGHKYWITDVLKMSSGLLVSLLVIGMALKSLKVLTETK